MNIKIFSIAMALAFLGTACTEEKLLDSGQDGSDVNLSLSLSVAGITSVSMGKSQAYEPADLTKEKLITDCVVAVFRNKSGSAADASNARIGYKEFTGLDASDGVLDLSGIETKTGDVRVLVIANPTNLSAYAGLMTYTEFKNQVVTETKFSSAKLMKVGEKLFTLKQGATAKNIELVQLAARVDIKIKIKKTGGDDDDDGAPWVYNITGFSVAGINPKSDLLLDNTHLTHVGNTQKNSFTNISWSASRNYDDDDDNNVVRNFSFYTYERATADNPIHVKITGDLIHNYDDDDDQKSEERTYTFDLDPVIAEDCNTEGIVHGNTYEVTGTIDPLSKTIRFTYTQKPWIVKDVNAGIDNIHYLFVAENDLIMPNTTEYRLTYVSDLDITCSVDSARYTTYVLDEDGKHVIVTEEEYEPGNAHYPILTVNKEEGVILIKADIPVNYVPTRIGFTITGKANDGSSTLTDHVRVKHYPTPYVEVHNDNKIENIPWDTENRAYGGVSDKIEGGYMHKNGANSDQDNYNLFMISSITSGDFIIGDPTEYKNGKRYTKEDEESNNMVSPKFVVASQHGIVANNTSYSNAKKRCSQYTEYPYMTPGTWRVPTRSEFQYVRYLQTTEGTAVKGLLKGSDYWCAYSVYYNGYLYHYTVNVKNGSYKSASGAPVRCVHDVY